MWEAVVHAMAEWREQQQQQKKEGGGGGILVATFSDTWWYEVSARAGCPESRYCDWVW